MTSNVGLRSNVCLGNLAQLQSGGTLLKQIRGRTGLRKLLARLEPGRQLPDAARIHLLPEQTAELFHDACAECGFYTVGPVQSTDGPVLAVRCPRGTCASSILPTRSLLLDSDMIRSIEVVTASAPGADISAIVTKVLSNGHASGRSPLDGCRRVAVRLSATLYYRFYAYADQEFSQYVKHALGEAVRNG